jgi:hypothetical protein
MIPVDAAIWQESESLLVPVQLTNGLAIQLTGRADSFRWLGAIGAAKATRQAEGLR